MDYSLRRSKRRTLSLEITPAGELLVRAPLRMPAQEIDAFVQKHADWARRHSAAAREKADVWAGVSPQEEAACRRLAARDMAERVARWSAVMGLHPRGVRITGAARRFGSCSGEDRLCFSWRLMFYPPAARDYVAVHELAHIVHKNHGPAFYALVARFLPDYRAREQLLRALPARPQS